MKSGRRGNLELNTPCGSVLQDHLHRSAEEPPVGGVVAEVGSDVGHTLDPTVDMLDRPGHRSLNMPKTVRVDQVHEESPVGAVRIGHQDRAPDHGEDHLGNGVEGVHVGGWPLNSIRSVYEAKPGLVPICRSALSPAGSTKRSVPMPSLSRRSMVSRYPFAASPNGWFSVAAGADVAPDDVLPLMYLGRDLVLFRGEDGVARVFDAHCPHLGAHLGVGGRVCGDGIACPFHGWHFDGDGQLIEVPGLDRTPRAAAQAWPVCERNGRTMPEVPPRATK